MCCKFVGLWKDFPEPTKPNSLECSHLTDRNLCAIYHTRPNVCRVDKSRPLGVTVSEWHKINEEACCKLQEIE